MKRFINFIHCIKFIITYEHERLIQKVNITLCLCQIFGTCQIKLFRIKKIELIISFLIRKNESSHFVYQKIY